MARRRMIEVSIAKDKELNSLSEFAQLLYLKILPHTDDFGRMEGDPETVKVMVDGFSKRQIEDYENAMHEIANKGLWLWYETDLGRKVVQFKEATFERINAFLIKKRGNPEYPEFNESLYKVISNDIKVYPLINNSKYKAESRKQKAESKEIEGKFDLFYTKYPRKTGKKEALKSFVKINPSGTLLEKILSAIELQKNADMLNNGQYTPHPATWLNQERWNDQIIHKSPQETKPQKKPYQSDGFKPVKSLMYDLSLCICGCGRKAEYIKGGYRVASEQCYNLMKAPLNKDITDLAQTLKA